MTPDPISLAILSRRFAGIVGKMQNTLLRTARDVYEEGAPIFPAGSVPRLRPTCRHHCRTNHRGATATPSLRIFPL